MTAPAPGWYPDPSGAPGKRYWNGQSWSAFPAQSAKATISTRQKWIVAACVVVAAVVLGSLSLLDKGPSKLTDANGHVPGTGGTAQTAAVGQPVRDGKFEFIVRGIANARGYTVVTMTVANIGNEAQTFFPENQKLIDTSGREYSCDSMAVYDFNRSGIIQLNPGLNETIAVPFQAPANTAFSAVELHDSAFSGGTRVSLGSGGG